MNTNAYMTLMDKLNDNPYIQMLEISFSELGEDKAVATMPVKAELANPYGSVHGGILYSMADIVCGTAACCSGKYSSTIHGDMSYARPAMNTEYVTCVATKVRAGSHLAIYRADILNDKGILLQTATFQFYLLEDHMGNLSHDGQNKS